VGKTTGIRQLLAKWKGASLYASADEILSAGDGWIREKWQEAILRGPGTLLVLDEIQKAAAWSETLKGLIDGKTAGAPRLAILGSSSLLMQKGLTESLAGRFELTRVNHWGLGELKAAFGYDLPRYLVYGGYPGAVEYERDWGRWYAYLKDSIVETVMGKDIVLHGRVAKPALFRQAFELACRYPAQELSYTKFLGTLQDRGNTELVKHYLDLFASAFLVRTVDKYASRPHRRLSSPKLLPLCPALAAMHEGPGVLQDPAKMGRHFEAAVGAVLSRLPGSLYYWRSGAAEVDWVYVDAGRLIAIEVKSGRKRSPRGLEAFREEFPKARPVFIDRENFAMFDRDPLAFLDKLAG
jgi:hypothetical protein